MTAAEPLFPRDTQPLRLCRLPNENGKEMSDVGRYPVFCSRPLDFSRRDMSVLCAWLSGRLRAIG